MALNKLYDSIRSMSNSFTKHYRLCNYATDYLDFSLSTPDVYSTVNLIKSSQHSYIVMTYVMIVGVRKFALCVRFRTLKDLCIYLDTLSSQLV